MGYSNYSGDSEPDRYDDFALRDAQGDADGTRLHSPAAASLQPDPDKLYLPGQPRSLAGIAMRSFCFGVASASSLTLLALIRLWAPSSPHWRLPFYCATVSTFHMVEFWAAARYNAREATTESFLLTENWPAYTMAHAFAFLECLVYRVLYWNSVFKPFPGPPISVVLGLLLVIGGQLVRTTAAVHAGPSFNRGTPGHRTEGRVLVTTGIYSILRHPSYFGLFWGAIGTQLVLGNTISFFACVVVLWSFFAGRVKEEEETLLSLFGRDYVDYKKRVGTMMPFIGW